MVTLGLIGLNAAVFAAMVSAGIASGRPLAEGAEELVAKVWWQGWDAHAPWRILAYAFAHAPDNWMHILGNMLFLWVFGPGVEDRLGRVGFLALYFAGAAASALGHSLWSPAPLIGASGAIATITGAFMVLFPKAHVRVLLFFLFVGIYNFPALGFVAFAIARDLFSLGMPSNVSNAAHLTGYGVGIVASFTLLATGALPREPYDLFSIFKHKQRLREFRAAADLNRQREARVRNGPAPGAPTQAQQDAAMTARADVSSRLARGDLDGAARAYRALHEQHPNAGQALVLSRQSQLSVTNQCFKLGDHATALKGYRLFAAIYPREPDVPHVRLMIGLILARYAKDAPAAREALESVLPLLHDAEEQALARQVLGELAQGAIGGGA